MMFICAYSTYCTDLYCTCLWCIDLREKKTHISIHNVMLTAQYLTIPNRDSLLGITPRTGMMWNDLQMAG
jgi:hypothetical protein